MGLILVCWPLLVADARLYYQVFGMACLFGALALAWNIHALTGAISLGHAAFFGLGAYAACLLEHYWHWPVWLAILVGPIAGAAYGLLWGLAFRRLRGAYFALATLASVELPKVVIDNWDSFTFGSIGLVGIPELPSVRLGQWELLNGGEPRGQYYLLLGFMLLLGWLHRCAMASRWGWAIRAVRENESTASSIGINVFLTHLLTVSLSSYLTAICGALYAHLVGLIEPGLVFNLQHNSLMDQSKTDPSGDKANKAETYKTVSMVGYGAGAVFLVAGATMYLVGYSAGKTAVAPAVVAGGPGAVLVGTF